LEWKQRELKPIGKGKVTVKKNKVIAFEQINQTKVVVKF
jgi:ribosome maturation factor RimP